VKERERERECDLGFVLRFSGFVGLRWKRADLVFFCGVALEKSRFRVFFVGLRWRRADLGFCGIALEKSRFRVFWGYFGVEQILQVQKWVRARPEEEEEEEDLQLLPLELFDCFHSAAGCWKILW